MDECERSIVGALLLSPDIAPEVFARCGDLRPKHFSDPALADVYGACGNVVMLNHERLTLETLADELDRMKSGAADPEFLFDVADNYCPAGTDIERYARTIIEQFTQREAITIERWNR